MKVLILFSGGLDSTILAHMALKNGHDLWLMNVSYWHPARAREFRAIEQFRLKYFQEYFQARDRYISIPVPLIGIGEQGPRITPARNQVFLSLAINTAAAQRIDEVWIGVNESDNADYIDCRPAFIDTMDGLAQGWGVRLRAPLLEMTKAQILDLAIELGVDLNVPWSCYEGGAAPCGTCNSCLQDPRLRAGD